MKINIECENEYKNWDIDINNIISQAKSIFTYYMKKPQIVAKNCLKDYEYDSVSFDFLFCDSNKKNEENIDNNSLDKMIEGAVQKSISKEAELAFFIAHGILHLLGFDHQSEQDYNFVVECQKEALGSIDIKYDKI